MNKSLCCSNYPSLPSCILDSCIALLADVVHGVPPDNQTVSDDADDAGPVHHLGHHKGEICRCKHEQGLNGACLIAVGLGGEEAD